MPPPAFLLCPGDDCTDAVAWVTAMRQQGARFWLDKGQPMFRCPARLQAMLPSVHARREAIVAMLKDEQRAGKPLAVPARRSDLPETVFEPEREGELDALLEWLKTVELPTQPYLLRAGLLVADAEKSHAYLEEHARPDAKGQVRVALLARLRALKKLADNGWVLPRPEAKEGGQKNV